jgi:hypothetical protein
MIAYRVLDGAGRRREAFDAMRFALNSVLSTNRERHRLWPLYYEAGIKARLPLKDRRLMLVQWGKDAIGGPDPYKLKRIACRLKLNLAALLEEPTTEIEDDDGTLGERRHPESRRNG